MCATSGTYYTATNGTLTALSSYYSNKSPEEFISFKINLAKWAKEIHSSDGFCNNTINDISTFITDIFCQIFKVNSTNKYVNAFLNDPPTSIATDEEIKSNNIFKQNEVEVEVATIHSVKGETHIATLYLETFYQGKHESQRIMKQLKGEFYIPPQSGDVYKKETLKMAHVAMSRPKYFLCMAIHRSRFDNLLDINEGGMWKIVNV